METEGNKVLAEFIELRWHENGTISGYHTAFNMRMGVDTKEDLKFSTSWDWLMPVWIKFRDLEMDEFKYFDTHTSKKNNLYGHLYRANSPSDFFPHLVEAVKWYQSTKK